MPRYTFEKLLSLIESDIKNLRQIADPLLSVRNNQTPLFRFFQENSVAFNEKCDAILFLIIRIGEAMKYIKSASQNSSQDPGEREKVATQRKILEGFVDERYFQELRDQVEHHLSYMIHFQNHSPQLFDLVFSSAKGAEEKVEDAQQNLVVQKRITRLLKPIDSLIQSLDLLERNVRERKNDPTDQAKKARAMQCSNNNQQKPDNANSIAAALAGIQMGSLLITKLEKINNLQSRCGDSPGQLQLFEFFYNIIILSNILKDMPHFLMFCTTECRLNIVEFWKIANTLQHDLDKEPNVDRYLEILGTIPAASEIEKAFEKFIIFIYEKSRVEQATALQLYGNVITGLSAVPPTATLAPLGVVSDSGPVSSAMVSAAPESSSVSAISIPPPLAVSDVIPVSSAIADHDAPVRGNAFYGNRFFSSKTQRNCSIMGVGAAVALSTAAVCFYYKRQ